MIHSASTTGRHSARSDPGLKPPSEQMSGFDLIPVDGAGGGGDPIHLPLGETVLGRGPFLGVSDKRVSRVHGLLENLNGQLRLKPTHLNPCFVQSSLSDDPRPLQRNSWYPLHHGDLFSLLPGQCIYRVVAPDVEDCTPRNSQMLEEEEELPVGPEPDEDPPPPPAAPSNRQEAANGSFNKGDSAPPGEEEGDRGGGVPPSITKRRVLPAWMLAAAAAPPGASSSSSSSSPKAAKRSKGPSNSAQAAGAKKATPTKTTSPEGAELSEEEMPRKRRRKLSDEEEEAAQSKTDIPPSVRLESKPMRSDGAAVDEGRGGGQTSTADTNAADESGPSEDEDGKSDVGRRRESSSVSAATPPRRTRCPYGKSCYRKNPVHFQECSHPGDSDYEEEEEEEEEEDRPECPYGTDCYRKNPLHRKEYKHTKRPARTTRTVPKKADDDDDEDEDFGDDDSFINDDSEDAGEDSDYEPPVSDDSGKDDVAGLQKEAKAFMKRRK